MSTHILQNVYADVQESTAHWHESVVDCLHRKRKYEQLPNHTQLLIASKPNSIQIKHTRVSDRYELPGTSDSTMDTLIIEHIIRSPTPQSKVPVTMKLTVPNTSAYYVNVLPCNFIDTQMYKMYRIY